MTLSRIPGFFLAVSALFSYAYAEDLPKYSLAPVTVIGNPDSCHITFLVIQDLRLRHFT